MPDSALHLNRLEVGPWPMNAYVVVDPVTQNTLLVDPGANPEILLAAIQPYSLAGIFITHGHGDHTGALEDILSVVAAPVYLHPDDAALFTLNYDYPLHDNLMIQLGPHQLQTVHTPGHTPGMCCLSLGDGRVLVGDSLFVGGPGHTGSAADFVMTMRTMQSVIFRWADNTRFFPGHGPSGTIAEERPAFNAFVERGWSPDLHGDITWEPVS